MFRRCSYVVTLIDLRGVSKSDGWGKISSFSFSGHVGEYLVSQASKCSWTSVLSVYVPSYFGYFGVYFRYYLSEGQRASCGRENIPSRTIVVMRIVFVLVV